MRVTTSVAVIVACLLPSVIAVHAQTLPPPAPGFVPPYEILRTVRAAGFDPLAPPLREGTTYVLRATDYRGILMRVVIDARTGAIRDANRIVPGPGAYPSAAYGQIGPYGPPSYGAPPYDGGPPVYGIPVRGDLYTSDDDDATPSFVPTRPLAAHPAQHANVTILPPLPRPRPADLASEKSAAATKPVLPADVKPDSIPDATATKPAAAPNVPPTAAARARLQPAPPISD
jgi:hypothetical protein